MYLIAEINNNKNSNFKNEIRIKPNFNKIHYPL